MTRRRAAKDTGAPVLSGGPTRDISSDLTNAGQQAPAGGPAAGHPPGLRGTVAPNGVADLIYLMWTSLSWSKAGQAALLVCAVGLAVSMVLGAVTFVVIGASPVWSAAGGLLAAGGVAVGAYGWTRR